jgi:hypothetical protein
MSPRSRQPGYPLPINPNTAYQRQLALGQQQLAAAHQRIQELEYMGRVGLGQTPTDAPGIEMEPRWKDYEKIPNIYVVSVSLDGTAGATAAGSKQLRPEAFVLKRITWATTGDTPPFADIEPGYSPQGRAVTVKWQDEFTQLMGTDQALISSLFGDSNGFLDIPRGALFQGKQALTVNLTRLHWPFATEPAITRFDFVFQGLGLLPRGVAQSGSAG